VLEGLSPYGTPTSRGRYLALSRSVCSGVPVARVDAATKGFVAAKDGTELGMATRTFPVEPILRKVSNARYEADKFIWIGSMNREVGVLHFWQQPPVSLDDVLAGKEYPVGATGATSDSATFTRVINQLLGAKLKVIPAYPGTQEVLLAVESGEIAGTAAVSWATLLKTRPHWISSGLAKVLMQMTVQRSAALPDVPTIKELVKNDLDRQVMDLILSCQDLGRPLILPPGVPPARVAALREAFDAVLRDPEALAEAKNTGLDLDVISGKEAAEMIARVLASPRNVIERARELY
jgi:tripartite-type tricarboxylate transporter receptor subunit TctC